MNQSQELTYSLFFPYRNKARWQEQWQQSKSKKWSTEFNNLNEETEPRRLLMLVACHLLCIPSLQVPVLTVGLWPQKLLFSPAAPPFEHKWLKQDSEFITGGQCNYLGGEHVTKINMTQSAQPLTLIHDGVSQCLTIERSGLLDFVGLLLFWFTVRPSVLYKWAIV